MLLGILAGVLAVLSIIFIENQNRIYNEEFLTDAQSLTEFIADEINNAYVIGEGYSRIFDLPSTLFSGKDYNVSISEGLLLVSWDSGSTYCPILAHNIKGSFRKGVINKIRNNGTSIIVNE